MVKSGSQASREFIGEVYQSEFKEAILFYILANSDVYYDGIKLEQLSIKSLDGLKLRLKLPKEHKQLAVSLYNHVNVYSMGRTSYWLANQSHQFPLGHINRNQTRHIMLLAVRSLHIACLMKIGFFG
ncbi:hypothetical protein N9Y17_05055 [Gammaproteobacteria bacterium]|nr:hypothetical protein [Gammaproteobacteria bacterium]